MKENLLSLSKIRPYKNMPDLIAEQLKDAILQGKVKGGTPLKQDEIAKQFDVSLIPVREALIQLESKKLVTCIRNKGAVVTKLSIEELRQLFELRRILEVGGISLITGPISSEMMEKLVFIVEKMETQQDMLSIMRYNRLFHQLICDCSGNPQVSDLYENLFVKIERYLRYLYDTIGELPQDVAEHKEIVSLLKEEKYDILQIKLAQHSKQGEEKFFAYLKEKGYGENVDFDVLLPFRLV